MFLGIEIGGSKLQVGIGPGDGTLLSLLREPVLREHAADGVREQILCLASRALAQAGLLGDELAGVGIGFGGPVDDETRRVLKSFQVRGWADFPMAEWAEACWHRPAVLGNDADVAGLAEALFGAGQGLSPLFYSNVGSGIGGALILDGRIYRGCGRGAGEIGHLWSDYDVQHFGAVSWKDVEDCSSGWGIAKRAGLERVEEVVAASLRGDAAARAVIDHARRRYAVALAHVIALCCPRRIVLGGGVAQMDRSQWLDPLREEVKSIAFPLFAECVDLVPAALGEEVVVHGALALAWQKLGDRK
jgi:glucokinase